MWDLPSGLPVSGRLSQVFCWCHDHSLCHGHPGAAPRQRAVQDGSPQQEGKEGGGKVSVAQFHVC